MEVAGGPREYHYYDLLNSICWKALEVTEGSWKTGRSFQIYMNLDQLTPQNSAQYRLVPAAPHAYFDQANMDSFNTRILVQLSVFSKLHLCLKKVVIKEPRTSLDYDIGYFQNRHFD